MALAPLEALYEHIIPLSSWISGLNGLVSLTADWERRVIVCWNDPQLNSVPASRATSLQEVVEEAHKFNLAAAIAARSDPDGWKRRNVFSLGRSLRGGQITIDFANPTTAAVSHSADWLRVFDAAGPSALLHLFTQYSVFYALDNSCFHQLCGIGAQNVSTRLQYGQTKKGIADVRFDRGALCYRQRARTTVMGWPNDHPFRKHPNEQMSDDERAALLIRQMLPRAHGETSVFHVSKGAPVSRKPPKMLRQTALPLVRDMLQKSDSILLKTARLSQMSQLPTHTLDEEEQEAIIHLVTQEPFALQATEGATQAATRFFGNRNANQREHQPCFLDFSCPHYRVVRFLQEAIRLVVPGAFFGSKANQDHVLRFVEMFVRAKRLDGVSLQALVEGFRMTDCLWLCPLDKDGKPARLARSTAIERTEMLQDFLHWVIDGLVMPLLRFNFFITESSATRNQLHYFRCDDWSAMTKPVLEKLKKQLYEKVERPSADALGDSLVRLLPKERGMRPIANLGYRKPIAGSSRKEPSINDKLAETRVILNFEQKRRPNIRGSSITTPNQIVKPLLELKQHLRAVLGDVPIYFVKIDVRACFDTIRQDRLLSVLRELIDPEAVYVLAKRCELTLRHGYVFRQYGVKSVLDQDEEETFADNVLDLASSSRRKIYVDAGGTGTLTAEGLFDVAKRLVHGTYLRFGEEIYRQKEGIPQGSCISSILCSLFYAHLDRHVLNGVLQARDNLLSRLLDDFLFISPREVDAERFLTTMLQNAAPYGADVAKEKSVVNFELPKRPIYQGITQVPLRDDFAWCGFVLDQHLDVRVDYSRQQKSHLRDSFSISLARRPGKHFLARFFTMARSMMFRVAFDARLNSLRSVRISVYQAFLVLAMRMYAYSTAHLSAKRGVVLLNRHRLLLQAAERLITSTKGGFRLPSAIDRKQVAYLGLCAFERAWSRKGREGQLLVAQLKKRIELTAAERRHWQTQSTSVLNAPSHAVLKKLRF